MDNLINTWKELDQYSWEDDPPSYDLDRLAARGMDIPEEPQ